MKPLTTNSKVAQMFSPVKSPNSIPFTLPPNLMIHHKESLLRDKIIVSFNKGYRCKPYGVSRTYQVLSRSLFIKKFDYIRDCLKYTLGFTPAQREVILRLLRLWAYYGQVYAKESQVTELPGCSKATFWRTVRTLKDLGLIHVINRFVIRPHAQISNLYRFDKLLIVIARYLAEHGTAFLEKWLTPVLTMPGRLFWSQVWGTPEARAAPGILAYSGP